MSRLNKFIKFIFIGGSIAFIILLVLLAIYVPPFLNAEKQVDDRIAKLKVSGKPVSIRDIIPPKVPDSRNAAIIYEQVFKKLDKLGFSKDEKIFNEVSATYRQDKTFSRWDDVRKVADKYRVILPLVEDAAAKPECRFNINWDVNPIYIKFDHNKKIRSLNRLISALAVIDAKEGDIDSSIRMIKLGLHTGRTLDNAPLLIGHLCILSTIATSCSSLRGIMNYGEISESDAKQLYALFSDIDLNKGWDAAMLSEQALGLSVISMYRKNPLSLKELHLDEVKPKGEPRLFWKVMTANDELFYLKSMEKALAESRLPYRESKTRNLSDDFKFPKYALMSAIALPIYSKGQANRDQGITEIDGSRISLALKAYKSRYGSYPKNLDELRSKLGWEIPNDPFSGKDFIYSKKGKGFHLYSIAHNLKDDSGKIREKHKDGSFPDENYDIVWDVKR
ncbi:MAG: hypothetical protein ACYC27_17745 [Armatimonadota bacterium]